MIYADYAATAGSRPDCVIQAVADAMKHPGNAGRGAHQNALDAGRILLDARMEIAEFFSVSDPSHVVFTSGITESLNTIIKGILTLQDHAITTWAEHNSVLRPLYEMQEQGMELTITKPDVASIESAFQPNTRMVIMTHGSNVIGNVYDIAAVGKLCKERGVLFAVDTAQTAGSREISMSQDNIDILCFTGHKSLMGPQGTGGICIGENMDIRPLKSGGTGMDSFSKKNPIHLPEHLEVGTLNIPGIAGLAAGIRHIREIGLDAIQKREELLARQFYQGIRGIRHLSIYGMDNHETEVDFAMRTPIFALNIGDYSSAEVSDELEQRFGILTRAGAHCAPLLHEHFHTREQGMVRFSFGYETTEEEVAACIEALRILAEEE